MKKMDRRYIPGDRWVECDLCGFGYRFSQMRKGVSGKQKGFNICPVCFDEKHPNEDYVVPVRTEGILEKVR
jgi:hypothetical protein